MLAKLRLAIFCGSLFLLSGCTPHAEQVGSCGCGFGLGGEQDLIANIGDRVFFRFDESALPNNADTTLGRQAAWMTKYSKVNVLVAGNADERGTETYNLALGQRRANAVRDYLVVQGISESRIQTISYGKDCPLAADHDEASYQQNRNAITSVKGFNPQNCH